MDDFAQMHIFFFVTTVAVVVVVALLCWALFYILKILRNVDKLSKEALDESMLLRADIAEMRANVKAEGFKWKHVSGFVRKQAERVKRGAKKVTN